MCNMSVTAMYCGSVGLDGGGHPLIFACSAACTSACMQIGHASMTVAGHAILADASAHAQQRLIG